MGLCGSKEPAPKPAGAAPSAVAREAVRAPSPSTPAATAAARTPTGADSRALNFAADVKQTLADPAHPERKPGHERGRSVTGGMQRTTSTNSASSDDNSNKNRRSLQMKKSPSGEVPTAKRNSGLAESLVALNSTTTNVRDFYDGIDVDDAIMGTGNWGVVKIITRKRDGKRFACKIVKLDDNMTDEQFDELRAEIEALRQLDHVAIAKLFETFEEPGHRLYLVMELLMGGELYSALVERSPTGRFDEIRTRKLARRMVSAIAYLHDRGLVHRDIKLENFCFRGDEMEDEIVLIDFGLAKLYEMKASMTEVVGSSYYIAPEIVEGSYSGPTPDMWSLGVILFMMLSGRPPFDGNSDANILRRTVKGRFSMDDEVWRTQVSTLAQDFVRRCLTRDPSSRITSKEALRHTWLTASDEALIDAGAGDDPARALAPVNSNTEKRMSQQQAGDKHTATQRLSASLGEAMGDAVKRLSTTGKRLSAALFGQGEPAALEALQKFAAKHELVQLFSQAVAYSLGRDELKEQMRLFVKLDRNSDGFITAADVEIGMLGAPVNEVDNDDSPRHSDLSPRDRKLFSSTSADNTPRAASTTAGRMFVSGSLGMSLLGQDEATRVRRRRRREANYLFASMDVSKHGKVSLNEFLAATLDAEHFFIDEKLLADAFTRITGDASGGVARGAITASTLQPMMGKRFTDRRAKRMIGEFVAIARFAQGDMSKNSKRKSLGNLLSRKSFADGDGGGDDDGEAAAAGDVTPRFARLCQRGAD